MSVYKMINILYLNINNLIFTFFLLSRMYSILQHALPFSIFYLFIMIILEGNI